MPTNSWHRVYLALNLARTRVHGRPFWSPAGKTGDAGRGRKALGGIVVSRTHVKGKAPLSRLDNGRQEKRVIGFEPTTFTLATCKPTQANQRTDNDLAIGAAPARSAFSARTTHETADSVDSVPSSSRELDALIAAWPKLPEAVRAGIVAMVRASVESQTSEGNKP